MDNRDDQLAKDVVGRLQKRLLVTQIVGVLALLAAGASILYSSRSVDSISLSDSEYTTVIEPGRLVIKKVGGESHQNIVLGRGGATDSFELRLDRLFSIVTNGGDSWSADLHMGAVDGQTVDARVQQDVSARLSVGRVDDAWVQLSRGEVNFRMSAPDQKTPWYGALSMNGVSFTKGDSERASLSSDGRLGFHDGDIEGVVAAEEWEFLSSLFRASTRDRSR